MLNRGILLFAAMIFAMPGVLAGNLVDLTVGHSQVVTAEGGLGTVIVGDDSIADATLGSGNTIILTGKALGSTNLIVLDEVGSQIMNSTLLVGPVDRRPTSTVRILKGGSSEREYVCRTGSGCTPSDRDNAVAAANLAAALGLEPAASVPADVVETETQPEGQP
jgi:Flp pilus assembly secretin CpaC